MNTLENSSWGSILNNISHLEYFKELELFVHNEYATKQIYPPKNLIFKAFELCEYNTTRVVILGQDPYHGQDQAHGLAFSVNNGIPIPPSLRNIFKELYHDLGILPALNGNLEKWAKQGVLLLNCTLTVQSKLPGSHQGKGWETFTDSIIETLSTEKEHLVFILWGAYAQSKKKLIDTEKHCILESVHPSPLSAHRGFFGSKPFSKTNNYLTAKEIDPIDWQL